MSDLPIVKPVLGLLKSRKFLQQVLTLGMSLLVLAIPQFNTEHALLLGAILTTGLMSVYGIAKEDAAKFASEVTTPSPLTLPDQIRMIVTEIVQAYLPNGSESVDKVSVNATISTSDSDKLPTEMSSSTQ